MLNIAQKQVIGLQYTICCTLARYSVFTSTAVVEQAARNGYPGTRFNTRRVPGYLNTQKSEHYARVINFILFTPLLALSSIAKHVPL